MANYKSEKVSLNHSAEAVFTKLSNLEGLGELLKNVPRGNIPADQLSMLEQVRVTPDTITFPAGPAGEVTLQVKRLEAPTLIALEGVGTPVPMGLSLHILPLTPDSCETYVDIELQIPAMLKPMVNGPLQKMADQFAQMLRQLPV